MSAGPPGPNGTTILMGLLGQAWPSAGVAATASDPINRLRRAMRCMMILPDTTSFLAWLYGRHAMARTLALGGSVYCCCC
jgi:hypothetical protein